MTHSEAIADLDAQYAAGDMDSDEYALERQRIEYEHGEQQSAMDERRVAA